MNAETSSARGEWVLVPRVPTEAMIDAWRDAPNWWAEAYAAMLAAAPQPPSAPVGDDHIDASDNAEYIEHCAGRLERLGLRVTAGALRVIAHEHRALAQQPAAVDEAMVERAWVAFCEDTGPARAAMRAALTAALTGERNG